MPPYRSVIGPPRSIIALYPGAISEPRTIILHAGSINALHPTSNRPYPNTISQCRAVICLPRGIIAPYLNTMRPSRGTIALHPSIILLYPATMPGDPAAKHPQLFRKP